MCVHWCQVMARKLHGIWACNKRGSEEVLSQMLFLYEMSTKVPPNLHKHSPSLASSSTPMQSSLPSDRKIAKAGAL